MRVLVTGGKGMLGSSLVPLLESCGHRVVHFDKSLGDDVVKADSVDRAVCAADMCIHLAALYGKYRNEESPGVGLTANIVGTMNVARACAEFGVPLVSLSTSEVYGHNNHDHSPPDILEQNGIYGISKLAAEGVVKHYCDNYGLSAVSIRPYMLYGPGEVPNGKYRSALANFIATAHRGGEFCVHSGCLRSWCYVGDFMDGLMLVIDNMPFDRYTAFSIGTEDYQPMESVADKVIEVVGKGSYRVEPSPDSFGSDVKTGDFTLIRELGFKPKVRLEEGIRLTYDWMLGEGLL